MGMHRNFYYFVGYTILLCVLLAWLIHTLLLISHDEFSFVWRLTDGVNKAVLVNFIAVFSLIIGRIIQLLVFGELRIIEVEHLMEQLPMFILKLLFNWVTTDKDMLVNVFLFGILTTFKVFHIILTDRMDFYAMKIVNGLGVSTTTKDVFLQYAGNLYFWLIPVTAILDFCVAKLLVYDVVAGVTSVVCLLFGFQFAMQGVEMVTYFNKLVLGGYEVLMYRVDDDNEDDLLDDEDTGERVWENKPFYIKGVDISLAILKLASHLWFIYLLVYQSGDSVPPISMILGTYLALREVYVEIGHLLKFIDLNRQLDSQLETATAEQLAASDNLCIICMEDMTSPQQFLETKGKEMSKRKIPKRLRCGHFMHAGCLKEWLERTDLCPLCRQKVFGDEPVSAEQEAAALNQNIQALNRDAPDEIGVRGEGEAEIPMPAQPRAGPEVVETDAPMPTNTEAPLPTPTPTSNPLDIPRSEYQTIHLSSLAVLPPNWILLPLSRNGDGYNVSLLRRHNAQLEVVRATSDHLRFYAAPGNCGLPCGFHISPHLISFRVHVNGLRRVRTESKPELMAVYGNVRKVYVTGLWPRPFPNWE